MKKNQVVSLSWQEVRDDVQKTNKKLFDIIEKISPDKNLPLYKLTYAYGDKIVNKGIFQLPAYLNEMHQPLPYDLKYCAIPLCLLLNKDSEVFLESPSRIIPLQYLYPGQFFGLFEALSPYPYHPYDPKPVWSVSAGARSVFMLPKITDGVKHQRIKRELHINASPPKNLSDHWKVFSEIANHPTFNDQQWFSDILVFPRIWLEKNDNDIGWLQFRNYLLELAWMEAQVLREKSTLGFLWESISTEIASGFKTKPYFLDTLQHLVFISLSARPGFRCIFQETSACPSPIIENVYNNIYDLGDYAPMIMGTGRLNTMPAHTPIYYSFNYPTLLHSAVEINKPRRIITGMREVKRLIDAMNRKINYHQTAVTKILQDIEYTLYHHEKDPYEEIELSKNIILSDQAISAAMIRYQGKEFSAASHFFRGCVSISKNPTHF